ncbi:hypothetical protein FWH30_00050 [Microgenomates group bacterium]|nr:hypothetical protein [Microgenomates group bacterium]
MATKYTVIIAGSSHNSLAATQSLLNNPHFAVVSILTPAPKPAGKKQLLINNPLHQFALENNIPLWLITNRLKDLQETILTTSPPDFLFVVDFGYFIPSWLLNWPKIAPLNLHPSALPKYRGASPGQFVILHDERESALTLMKLNSQLDQGDIIYQHFFSVNECWRAADYYQHAFNKNNLSLINQAILDFAAQKITSQPQPTATPTPLARELTKNDGFIPLDILFAALDPSQSFSQIFPSFDSQQSLPSNPPSSLISASPRAIDRAVHAFYPFPIVWTLIPTSQGPKRVKLLNSAISSSNKLLLTQVQLEGKPAKTLTF